MLVVIGHARAREGKLDALVNAAADVASATRADRGCETYTFAVDVNDPAIVVSVEVWTDQPALDAHLTHDHTQAFLAAVGDLVEGEPSMSFYSATCADEASSVGAQA